MPNQAEPNSWNISPIGFVRSGSSVKFYAPNQPDYESGQRNLIELNQDSRLELALSDLEGFDRIWLVSWFHKNSTWRPRVLPPRGPANRRGVFATRSPHRPNPIGLTSVQLFAVQGRFLEVGPLDLIDGTSVPSTPTLKAVSDGWKKSKPQHPSPLNTPSPSLPRQLGKSNGSKKTFPLTSPNGHFTFCPTIPIPTAQEESSKLLTIIFELLAEHGECTFHSTTTKY